jgi:hypothetical protein
VITLRIFHPGRLVMRLGRGGMDEREERWLVLHRSPVAWAEVLGGCLQLMLISAEPATGGLRLERDAGTICWQQGTLFSVLRIRIRGFSHKKHELIFAALRKAARFQ